MAGDREKPRFGEIGRLRLSFSDFHRFSSVFAFGDVGEGDDDPLHPIVLRAIGQRTAEIPGAAERPHFPLDRRQRLQHGMSVGQQVGIGSTRIEIGERAADIAGDDVEEKPRRRCEKPNIEIGVEKQRRHIRAVEDILQIV